MEKMINVKNAEEAQEEIKVVDGKIKAGLSEFKEQYIFLSDVLKWGLEKVKNAIDIVGADKDYSEYELDYSFSYTLPDNTFSNINIYPTIGDRCIYQQTEEVAKLLPMNEYLQDAMLNWESYILDLDMHKLFMLGVNDIANQIRDLLDKYGNSLFYQYAHAKAYDGEAGVKSNLIHINNETVLFAIEDIVFKYDTGNICERVDNKDAYKLFKNAPDEHIIAIEPDKE